jgi:hypothetical protein
MQKSLVVIISAAFSAGLFGAALQFPPAVSLGLSLGNSNLPAWQAAEIASLPGGPDADSSLPESLNKESQAQDNTGIRSYSEHLVKLLVGNRAGPGYISYLSDTLAKDEALARAGKKNLVPEIRVAQAYNSLMKQIGAPSSLLSDESAVHRLRSLSAIARPSPTLYSAGRNGSNCYPAEAVFLLNQLIVNNGGPRRDPAPAPTGSSRPGVSDYTSLQQSRGPQAWQLIASYSAAHPKNATNSLYDSAAKALGLSQSH